MIDLSIINGLVFVDGELSRSDIGIHDGKVLLIGSPGALPEAKSVIDAQGRYVLPGAIDSHFHCRAPSRSDRETFLTGTQAAAHGGVTTVLEMPICIPATSDGQKLADRRARAEEEIVIDLGFYSSPASLNPERIRSSVEEGAISWKTFLQKVPVGREEEFEGICLVDHGDILTALELVRDTGMISVFHAEDHPTYTVLEKRLRDNARIDPQAHVEARPAYVEAISISTLLFLAGEVGTHVHIPHVSSALGVEVIRQAKKRGVPVTAETCPQYLAFTSEALDKHGPYARCNPPLKSQADVDALWEALRDGTIDTIATDHSPFTTDDKDPGFEDIWDSPPGFPGVDILLPFVMSAALNGDLPLARAIELVTSAPARIFGIDGAKGSLELGRDADVVIYDPSSSTIVDTQAWLTKSRDCGRIWNGYSITGEVVTTLVRGKVVYDDGSIVASPGTGLVIRRSHQR